MKPRREPVWKVEPLGRRHDRAGFSSSVVALDDYLRRQALQDARRHVATPMVACEPGTSAIAGFYTLSMTSIELEGIPGEIAARLPRYPRVPAVLLGRLAVAKNQRGRGLGRFLLMDAIARSLASEIAWVAMLVDAKDESARRFYAKFGFIALKDAPNSLFLHRKTLQEAFA